MPRTPDVESRRAVIHDQACGGDLGQPLQAAVDAVVQRHRTGAPSYKTGRWREVFADTALFTSGGEHHLPFEQRLDLEGFDDRVMSTSVLAALVDDVRADVEAEVRAIAADWPALIRLSYVTDVFLVRRS